MDIQNSITYEDLCAAFSYDHKTGVFVRRQDAGRRHKAGSVAGYLNSKGYAVINHKGKIHKAHRLAWLYHYGVNSEKQIDHINRDKSDNRIENLREATHAENQQNSKIRLDNTSGYKGVSLHTQTRKWVATCYHNKKRYYLGMFESAHEASAEYQKFAASLHGGFFAKT